MAIIIINYKQGITIAIIMEDNILAIAKILTKIKNFSSSKYLLTEKAAIQLHYE